MKKEKGYAAALVAALLCATVLVGCGSLPGESGSGEGSSEGDLFSEPEKEPKIVADFDYADLTGTWYGIAEGNLYALKIEENEKPDDPDFINPYSTNISKQSLLTSYVLGGKDDRGYIQIIPQVLPENAAGVHMALSLGTITATERSDEEGNPIEYCIFCIKTNDAPYVVFCQADLYDDGSLHAVRLTRNKGGEEPLYNTSEFAVFRRELPLSPKVDRERGILSGIWYVYHEEEELFLIAYPDRTFCIYQDEIPASGIYQMKGDTFSLIIKVADGETYIGDDAIQSITLMEDNSFDLGEVVMPPLAGKHSGSWTSVPDKDKPEDPAYHMELTEKGSFTLAIGDREAAGICLNRSDTEMGLLFLNGELCFSNGWTSILKIMNSVTVNPDGSLTLTEGTREIRLEKD